MSVTVSGRDAGHHRRNGAGKSTLLALITARRRRPTRHPHARQISSLLELGAGFHSRPQREEKHFLYGAIMGLTAADARALRRHCGVRRAGQLIDEPVKHYSSGMYVRLGFAVAVEVDPTSW